MSNKTIDMFKIRQLLRLYADGRGSKFISASTGIARNTVKKYLIQFTGLRLTIGQADAMSDGQLAAAFLLEKPKVISRRTANLELMLPQLAAMLKKRGITKQLAYASYIVQFPDGFRSSAFLTRLNAYMGMGKPSMRVPHKVGDKLFIDFTGGFLKITDKETGEVHDVQVFVAILGCSQLTYVTAVGSLEKKKILCWPVSGYCISMEVFLK